MKYLVTGIFLLLSFSGISQQLKTRNIIIVTLDGYRWQEIFEGADSSILFNKKYVTDNHAIRSFWSSSALERRNKLMPFMWNTIAFQGQLYGNRNYGNKVNCSNNHLLSYPGYSEMLVGFPEKRISSNDKKNNPNATVLEFIQGHNNFHNKVAAFATWDVFPYILRADKAMFHVNAGNELAVGNISDEEQSLNTQQSQASKRYDTHTFKYAWEYMKREKPRVIFIGFDGTDSNAHEGRYDQYLASAHDADAMIAKLWAWVQTQEEYKDQTTLFITTDHGRGKGRNSWKSHRLLARGSRHTWFAVIGPDTPSFGELKFEGKYYQKQVAKTIAAFLGLTYERNEPVGDIVQTMMAPQASEKSIEYINSSAGQ